MRDLYHNATPKVIATNARCWMGLVLLLFVHCNQNCPRFSPLLSRVVSWFLSCTQTSPQYPYTSVSDIYIRKKITLFRQVFRYIWCPTLPPYKNPPKEGIYHAVCQLALNQCWVFGMITQTSTVSKFIVRLSFFYMGISILKNTKKKWWNKIMIKGR